MLSMTAIWEPSFSTPGSSHLARRRSSRRRASQASCVCRDWVLYPNLGYSYAEVNEMAMVDIIGEIDAEISRLQQAKALLSGTDSVAAKRRPGRPIGSGLGNKLPVALPSKAKAQPRRKMSAAGRARISAAMKARWADRKSTRLNSSHLGISYAVF